MGVTTLTRCEFLVLRDAVQAPGVVGLDAGELVPANTGEHKALVAEGIQRLSERGALRVESGVNVLDTTLIGMAMVLANPALAVITTRDNPGVGPQLFLHYMAEPLAGQETRPSGAEQQLVAAMTVPELGGSVAVLRCEKGQVVDGRNLAVVQGVEMAWLVKQAKVGSGKLAVTSCDEASFRSLIADW